MEHWPCFGVDANIGRWAFCYPAAQEDVALLLEQVGLLVIVPVLGRTLGMLPISGQEGGQCCSVPGALSPGKVLKARQEVGPPLPGSARRSKVSAVDSAHVLRYMMVIRCSLVD